MSIDLAAVPLAKQIAGEFSLDPQIVCAVCEQESGWDVWSVRYEPAFMAKYVAGLYTNNKISATEAYTRAMSWGLMQLMGETAREEGFAGKFLSELCDPEVGIECGCKHLSHCFIATKGDPTAALLRWNGGGNPDYAKQVLARMVNYK